jgi:Arc/MetJ family transcription regulator
MAKRRRVSIRIDQASLTRAKEILETKTITETVDVALDEILKRRSDQLDAASSASRAATCSPT